jgi:hypothetical protein
LGFAQNSNTGDMFWSGDQAVLWALYRQNQGGGAIFDRNGVGDEHDGATNTGATDTYQFILTVLANGTGSYSFNDSLGELTYSNSLSAAQISSIKYVGLTEYGAAGTVNNFQLTYQGLWTYNPTNVTWTGGASNDFEVGGNWDIGTAPANNITDSNAIFTGIVTTNQPTLTASRAIAGLTFQTSGWNLFQNSNGNTLTLGWGGITDSSTGGTNTIDGSATLALGISIVPIVVTNAGQTLAINSMITGGTGTGLAISGAGTVAMNGGVTLNGGAFAVKNGTVSVTGMTLAGGGVSVSGGTASISGLAMNGAGVFSVTGGAASVAGMILNDTSSFNVTGGTATFNGISGNTTSGSTIGGGTVTLSGTYVLPSLTLSNDGQVNFVGTTSPSFALLISQTGTIGNTTSGTITLPGFTFGSGDYLVTSHLTFTGPGNLVFTSSSVNVYAAYDTITVTQPTANVSIGTSATGGGSFGCGDVTPAS